MFHLSNDLTFLLKVIPRYQQECQKQKLHFSLIINGNQEIGLNCISGTSCNFLINNQYHHDYSSLENQ